MAKNNNGKRGGNGAVPAAPVLERRAKRIRKYSASIHFATMDPAHNGKIPSEFAGLIRRLEGELGMPVWMMIQNGRGRCCDIDAATFKGFQKHKNEITDGPVALLIESAGGIPGFAYYIARYFQRRSSRFVTLVPQYAKSAATLLALAGQTTIMGRDAELGPLDVQVFDPTRERYGSALNTLQSLERLHADTLAIVDGMMQLLVIRTGKKVDALLSHVLKHGTDFVRPLVEKIDTLDYTEKSRAMKMAEEYAIRLMVHAGYDRQSAEIIARKLVTEYPDHDFIIDAGEAKELETLPGRTDSVGIRVEAAPAAIESIFDDLLPFLDSLTIVGRLQEV